MVVSDYQQMDRILKEERNYIISIIKKIKASGCNVLLIQKSILRDAVTDLSLHYLAKAKIHGHLLFFFRHRRRLRFWSRDVEGRRVHLANRSAFSPWRTSSSSLRRSSATRIW